VDPEVGTARRALAASAGGQFFVAPDNGLLTPVLDGARVMELAVPRDASPTFHGRDVFAPAAARLAMGARLADLGVTVDDAIRFPLPAPREVNGALVGEVIYVDRFGTLVTNFPEWMLSGGDRLHLGGSAVTVGRTFGDVERGGLVAFVGSGGTVEIAVRDGSAARTLGAGVGGEVRLERLS
jgi:S-adenosylmethionine hydrolase